jgi:hypothetical protein
MPQPAAWSAGSRSLSGELPRAISYQQGNVTRDEEFGWSPLARRPIPHPKAREHRRADRRHDSKFKIELRPLPKTR